MFTPQPHRSPAGFLCAGANKVQPRCPPVSGSASRCSHGNELDLLVVGRCVLKSRNTNTVLKQDYSSAFELD
jgi:hypothetical protein